MQVIITVKLRGFAFYFLPLSNGQMGRGWVLYFVSIVLPALFKSRFSAHGVSSRGLSYKPW